MKVCWSILKKHSAIFAMKVLAELICEQKHMGSRAIVIVCKDEDAATKRFGVIEEGIGICYTRTGRRFFNERELESEFLARVQAAISAAGIWENSTPIGSAWTAN